MKKSIKGLIPPLLLDKLLYIRSYKSFFKYKDLVAQNLELKEKHKGKRCFILGSGPSIKKEDLTPLKDEIVFALNNFYVHEDFQEIMSGDVDKYYMTAPIHPPQTEDMWKVWFEDMEESIPRNTNVIFGLNEYASNIKSLFDRHGLFEKHKINWYFTGVNTGQYYRFDKKDIDMTNMIWNANTVSVYALMSAVYMGFDEIYLLGMDHTNICFKNNKVERFYEGKAEHHKVDYLDSIEYKKNKFINTYTLWMQYILIERFVKSRKQKIINLSEESLLDIFGIDRLNQVLKDI